VRPLLENSRIKYGVPIDVWPKLIEWINTLNPHERKRFMDYFLKYYQPIFKEPT
jgi:hypothetical protein